MAITQTMNLNYENDPLLSENKLFINNSLNVYAILVKKEDFDSNKKGSILKKCPYIYDEYNEIQKEIHTLEDNNFIKVRQLLSDYLKIKRIRKDTFYNWFEQKRYPLPLIRAMFHLLNKDITEALKDKKITDFCNKSQIKLPVSYNEVTSEFMAYLIGIHLGDGTLNKERWKVVDGDREIENLKYSYRFLEKIRKKIREIFSVVSEIYKIKGKGAYELIISNKWLCRYFNFVYNLEYNEKKNPKIPKLLIAKKDLVFRGLMDTDGSIKNYRIAIGTKYGGLYENLRSILEEHKIKYREKINNLQRENSFYILEIQKDFLGKFIKIIGFSHPRKLNEVVKYLKTTSGSSTFLRYSNYKPKISGKEFIEICHFLRPVKNAGKVRFISEFNKLKKDEKNRIINNINLNFGVNKEPNKKGYINSYKIEKILTNCCIYKKNREPTNQEEINKIVKKVNSIWE